MKKLLTIGLLAAAGACQAQGWGSVDLDQVRDLKTHKTSQAQYIRLGTSAGGMDLGLQARTATFQGGGMVNSVELTAGKNVFGISPFVGVGFDNGFNGAHKFQYALVGASTGFAVGKNWVYGGVKTRVNWDKHNPDQTVAFGGISVPVTPKLSANAGVSRSGGDIKESAYGLGIRYQF